MTATRVRFQFDKRQLIILVLAAIALYVIIPQIGSFRRSLDALSSAEWSYVLPALAFTAASYAAAASTYCLLAWHQLSYFRTLLIEVAGMFVNRLLPAGIGGIGVNYLYLSRNGHSNTRAASVVAANNLLGIVGNMLLIAILLVLFHDSLPPVSWPRPNLMLVLSVILLVAIIWFVLYRLYGERFRNGIRDFFKKLTDYKHRPGRLAAALGCSVSLTLSNVLSFWFCVLAMHIGLTFLPILLIFSFGVMLGAATPTPGGLGGVEAAMVAGLALYGVPGGTALAAVLIYRLISYWLPLGVGAAALVISQRRGYL